MPPTWRRSSISEEIILIKGRQTPVKKNLLGKTTKSVGYSLLGKGTWARYSVNAPGEAAIPEALNGGCRSGSDIGHGDSKSSLPFTVPEEHGT